MKDEGEKRQQMMENLFGVNSDDDDDDDDEEEVDSEHESNHHRPSYLSDENDGGAEQEIETEAFVEGQGEAEGGESADESEARETDSYEKDDFAQKGGNSRRRDVIDSGSERSDDEEIGPGGSGEEERDLTHVAQSATEIRDVFGDSDEEELPDYGAHHDMGQRSPIEEEDSYGKNLRPDDLVHDEDARYASEEDIEAKPKEKPVGPPMELEIPLRPPPALPDKRDLQVEVDDE